MLILALDTATDAVAVAVWDATTDRVLAREVRIGAASHGEHLGALVDGALRTAGIGVGSLTAVGVGRGPGPFTGLRIGLVHAGVLGWALGIPVHGVCTLDVLAAEASANGLAEPFLVATDARRREVHWARYDAAGHRVEGPVVGPAADIPERGLPVVGAGALRYPEALGDARPPLHPDPVVLARLVAVELARGAPPDVTPIYLRRPDVTMSSGPKRVTPR